MLIINKDPNDPEGGYQTGPVMQLIRELAYDRTLLNVSNDSTDDGYFLKLHFANGTERFPLQAVVPTDTPAIITAIIFYLENILDVRANPIGKKRLRVQ